MIINSYVIIMLKLFLVFALAATCELRAATSDLRLATCDLRPATCVLDPPLNDHNLWVMDKTLTPSPWTTLTDYPDGLPRWTTPIWTTPKNTILDEYYFKSCDFILTLHEPAYFCSAWPSAAILNNYTNNHRWTQKA